MHVPDGFLDLSTSVATGAVSVGVVGLSLQRAQHEVREAGPALPGLVAAFVFAVQMVNFPVGAGTSGHLMGGALAAALVGPWTAVVCLSVVLLVQGLLFADGGLTALGTNVLLIGVVTVLVGYAVTRAVEVVLPRRVGSVVPAAAVGAFVSVPAAALVFVALYAVGGAVPVDLGQLTAAMLGWHTLIGVGEGVITAAVLSAVVATRPDLVRAARLARPELVLVAADGARTTVSADGPRGDRSDREVARTPRRPVVVGLLASSVVAGVVSLVASSNPDGLEFVGGALGFDTAATSSAVAGSPLADYVVAGVGGPLGGTLAGLVGVGVTVALGVAVAAAVARRRS